MEDDVPLGQQQDVVEEVVHLWCRLQKRNQDCRLRRQICALSFRPHLTQQEDYHAAHLKLGLHSVLG